MGGACFSFRKKWLKGINRYIIDYLRQTGYVQTTIIRGSCTPTNGEHITAQYMGGACFSFCKTNGRMLYNRHSILFASSMQRSIHVIDIHVCKLIHHCSTKSYCAKKSLILYIIIIITVDREIFAFKYFRVINVRVSNFRHKVQEVKIIHGVFYFRVLNFRRPREAKIF